MRIGTAMAPVNENEKMEIVNKIPVKGIVTRYAIESVEKDASGAVVSAEAVEILPEGSDKEPKKVTITADNDYFFTIKKWLKDTEIPTGFVVRNGVLERNGVAVEMGNIVAETIIKLFPGQVIFTAKDEDDLQKIVAYIPSRDKFDTLASEIPTDLVSIDESDTRIIYGYSHEKVVNEKDDDGKAVTNKYFDGAGLVVITAGKAEETEVNCAIDVAAAILSDDENYLYIPVLETKVTEGDEYYCKYESCDKGGYVVAKVSNYASIVRTAALPDGLKMITKTLVDDCSVVYIGADYIQFGNGDRISGAKIKEVIDGGYNYLVEVTPKRDYITKYVMATEDFKKKTIVKKETLDRGDIITVE